MPEPPRSTSACSDPALRRPTKKECDTVSDSDFSVIPESRHGVEYSEAWDQDVFYVTSMGGERFYLHSANITIEGDEFASLTFRRQIRRGAQAQLPATHEAVELGGMPQVRLTRRTAAEVDVDDYSLDI